MLILIVFAGWKDETFVMKETDDETESSLHLTTRLLWIHVLNFLYFVNKYVATWVVQELKLYLHLYQENRILVDGVKVSLWELREIEKR